MYSTLLVLHSWFRWLVLVSLVFAVYRAFAGWKSGKPFGRLDNVARHTAATIAHIQFCVGITLYFFSPIASYLLHHFGEAVHLREIRFFGMEHIVMMLCAITIITIGSIRAKRKKIDRDKFRMMAKWYSIALILILASIPWGVLFLVSRPLFRSFSRNPEGLFLVDKYKIATLVARTLDHAHLR